MIEGSGCLAVMGYRWWKGQVVWLLWGIDDGRVRLFGCYGVSIMEVSGCLAVMGYRWWKGQVVWLWWDIDDGRVRLFGCGNRVICLGIRHPKGNWVCFSYYMAKSELKASSGQHNQQNNKHFCIHVTHCNFWMANCPFTMFSEMNISVSNHKHVRQVLLILGSWWQTVFCLFQMLSAWRTRFWSALKKSLSCLKKYLKCHSLFHCYL